MKKMIATGVAATLVIATAAAYADDDHEEARRAFSEGRILSLRAILEKVESEVQGDLLEVEFETKRGRMFYEVKVLSPEGRVVEMYYDAETGERLVEEDRRRRRDGD